MTVQLTIECCGWERYVCSVALHGREIYATREFARKSEALASGGEWVRNYAVAIDDLPVAPKESLDYALYLDGEGQPIPRDECDDEAYDASKGEVTA